jgi:hypothetical protein
LKRRVDERLASSVLKDSLARGERQGESDDEEWLGVMSGSVGDVDADADDVDADKLEAEAGMVIAATSLVSACEASEERRLEAISSSTAFCRSAGRGS